MSERGGTARRQSRLAARRSIALVDASPEYLQKRAELLRIAARLFSEKGYGKTGLADIAAAAGTDRASVYYYFRDRQELYEAVVTEGLRDNVVATEAIVRGPGKAAEKLHRLITLLMISFKEKYPYLQVYIQEDHERLAKGYGPFAESVLELGRRHEAAVEQIIQQGVSEGSFRFKGPLKVVVKAIIGMVHHTHRWYRPEGSISPEEVADGFVELVVSGIGRPQRKK